MKKMLISIMVLVSLLPAYDLGITKLVSAGLIPDNGYDEIENIKNVFFLIFHLI